MSKRKIQKKPKLGASPLVSKVPRSEPVTVGQRKPSWVFNTMDTDHPRWGWYLADTECLKKLQRRLSNFESMTWLEIERKDDSHSIPVSRIVGEAQRRLIELRQDDISDVYSLRISGRERLWGIRDEERLKILWWDPDHEICPAPLKYT